MVQKRAEEPLHGLIRTDANTGSTPQRAIEFREAIHAFANAGPDGMERLLVHMVKNMKEMVDPDTLDRLIAKNPEAMEFNARLAEAVEKAFKTPIATRDGAVYENWLDGYIVLALGADGAVLGYASTKGILKNLHYAVSKNLCSMLLEGRGFADGILDVDGFYYLKGLGLTPGENLFIGGSRPVEIDGKDVYLAVTTSYGPAEYIKGLIRGTPEDKVTRAGAVEHAFGELVLQYLTGWKKDSAPFVEPKWLALQRILD